MSAIDRQEPIWPTFARFDCVRMVFLILIARDLVAALLTALRLSERPAPGDLQRSLRLFALGPREVVGQHLPGDGTPGVLTHVAACSMELDVNPEALAGRPLADRYNDISAHDAGNTGVGDGNLHFVERVHGLSGARRAIN